MSFESDRNLDNLEKSISKIFDTKEVNCLISSTLGNGRELLTQNNTFCKSWLEI